MVPKFANPHLLSQDVEITTRSEIAERVGFTSVVHDESLKRDLDDLLRDIWADALAETSIPSKAKKRRKVVENHTNEDNQLGFRLVSSMKHPQRISLAPKPPPPIISRGPDCEDNEIQAEVRRVRALSVAVEFKSIREAAALTRQVDPKPVTVETKVPLASTPLAQPLPPLILTEEGRTRKAVQRVATWNSQASVGPATSPHEPRVSCVVLPMMSAPGRREMAGKNRKPVKERSPPAYWRPSSDLRGKCMGYALGYPSNWAPDQLYVRDVMKRGVEST